MLFLDRTGTIKKTCRRHETSSDAEKTADQAVGDPHRDSQAGIQSGILNHAKSRYYKPRAYDRNPDRGLAKLRCFADRSDRLIVLEQSFYRAAGRPLT